MMHDHDRDIELSTKHVGLKAALFALAFIVAVSAFAAGISGLGRKEAGVYAVEAKADDETPLYGGEMTLQYRFSGSSAEIREATNRLREVYSASLKHSYILLDAGKAYDGQTNLATLNASLGQEVELSEELFDVLADAYDRTMKREGYNLFAGPLYAVWTELLYLEEPEPFDPLNSAESRTRIERIAAAVNDLDNFRFEIVDAQRRAVRFDVSEEMLALLEEYELPQTVLDLNILRDAYELRLVADALEAQGYGDGCLSTDSGIAVSLPRYSGGEFCLYGRIGEDTVQAATAGVEASAVFSQVHIFPYFEGEYGFYAVQKNGVSMLRHPYLTASGEYPNVLDSSCVLSSDGDIVETRWENLRLNGCGTIAEAEALARGETHRAVAYTLPDGTRAVYANAAGMERLAAAEDYGYRLSGLDG